MPLTLRNEDIGWFHPDHDDPQDDGMIIDRRCLVFTDVHLFEKHIQAFLDNESTRGAFEKQLVALFPSLLRRPALIWWITETTRRTRQDLCAAGLDALLESLTERFTRIYGSNNRFNMCKLTLRDFAGDERALSVFVQKKLRYARLSALITDDNTNWDSVMFLILQDMEPVIHQNIRFPKDGKEDEDLSEYMAYLDRSRSVILSKALRKQAKKKISIDHPQ